jgi:hypothetical protein
MKLTKTQSYAIQYLLAQNKTSIDISTELKIPLANVEKFIEKNKPASTDNTLATTTSKVTASDLMIRHTRDKKTNSVAIMTKEASEMSDAARATYSKKTDSNHIYKPRQ